MIRILKILFIVSVSVIMTAVTCACILPFDHDIPPYREPVSVTVTPSVLETGVYPETGDAGYGEIRSSVLYDDGTTGHDAVWCVGEDGIEVLSTAWGILRFRAVRPGTYEIKSMTLPFERKDGKSLSAVCTVTVRE